MRAISAPSRILASTLKGDELYEARLVEALDAIKGSSPPWEAPRRSKRTKNWRELEKDIKELRGLGLA